MRSWSIVSSESTVVFYIYITILMNNFPEYETGEQRAFPKI